MNNCDSAEGDRELAETAAAWLKRHDTTFAFVYFGYTDIAGHNHGWMTEPYIEAIANADQCIGTVLDSIADDTLVIISSDHGGHDQTHGTDRHDDMTIPFIINGPGIPQNSKIEHDVNITDIAPTIINALGLEPPSDWIGNVVYDI